MANFWPASKDHARLGLVMSLTVSVERFLPILLLGVSVVSVPLMMLSPTGVPRLHSLQGEKERVDLEVSRVSDEIRRLRVEVRHVRDDPAKIEQVARDQLGLVRQTELVLQFGD